MNQDNKEFELSGTLGSLSDAALNNLANQNPNDATANNIEQNNIVTPEVAAPINNEIEMLDISIPPVEPTVNQNPEMNPETHIAGLNSSIDNLNNDLNNFNIEPIQTMPAQPTLDPIPTNFDIGDIGSVPPIDPTGKGEKKKTKKKNTLFIFLVSVFILTIGVLLYYYLHISKGTLDNAVVTKELTLELGETLSTDINDYATFKSISSSNCILDTKKIDVTRAGTYEYTITCGNKTYKGNIILKDSKAPVVKTKTIVKKVNDTITPEEFISECNESSDCIYTFENPELVQTNIAIAGTYDVNLIVKDANDNTATVGVKLIVIDSDIKVYLNCVLSDQIIDGFNGTVSYIDKIGISPESQYVGIYFRIKEFMASTEEDYNIVKNNYITNGTVDINNGEGTPIFDDTNLIISFEETLSGEADFGTNYSAIKTHYENTNNYRCNIMNVN